MKKGARLISRKEAVSNTLKGEKRVNDWIRRTLHPKKKK